MTQTKIAILAALALGAGMALADDSSPCKATKFETRMTEAACKKGGQKEAKRAWQAWQKSVSDAHPDLDLSCKSCHLKVAPDFPLTSDALDTFHKYDGH